MHIKIALKVTIYIFIISILLSGIIAAKSPDSAEISIDKGLSNRNAILLKNAQFDTSIPLPAIISTDILSISQYPDNVDGYYIVQFSGYIKEEYKQAVRDMGAVIYDYVPNNAFIVRMNTSIKSRVEILDGVQWIGVYQPSYRISPVLSSAISEASSGSAVTQEVSAGAEAVHEDILILLFDSNDNERVLSEIENLGGDVVDNSGEIIRVRTDVGKIPDFATINGVSWIEKYVQPVTLNDVAANITNVYDVRNTHGLTGRGQTVAVADSGLDTGIDDHGVNGDIHLDFDNRVTFFNYYGSSPDDNNGHGTHTTGSVAGNGSRSSGQYKGMAPEADIISQGLGDDSGSNSIYYSNITQIFQDAYNNGARIHSNSWGSDVGGDYTVSSQDTDKFTWNNKDFVIVFAAGNSGISGINSPGTAKNTITVGASENYRPPDSRSDDIDDIAYFSSIGPTDDNRIKPDVVAPGTFIISTRSSMPDAFYSWGIVDDYYAYSSGTSMSTPLTAGTVALIRQYYVENESISPSAALLKATLINGAANLSLSSNAQGWGRVDIEKSLFPASPRTMRYHDDISLNTSESWNVDCYVNDAIEPLKITLVWTDYKGNPAVIPQLVNNLDLKVTGPSGSHLGNGGDDINNVEQVELSSPPVGLYTIKVNGTNIPQGPQPFALVISCALEDEIPPSASDEFPTNNSYTTNNTTVVAVNITDSGTGVNLSSINMTINGSIVTFTNTTILNGYRIQNITSLPYGDGIINVSINATDNESNLLTYSWSFTIDTTPPTSNTPSDREFSANATANFDKWILTDLHPGYYWVLRNDTKIVSPILWTNNTNITVSIDTNNSLGDFNYTIRYNDSANNNGTQDTVIITINDTTSPYASGESPANNSNVPDNTPQISVNISDNASGVNPSSIVMKVNGSTVTSTITSIAGGYSASNITIIPFSQTKVVNVTVNATDNNSNVLNHSWSFTVDGDAPIVTNPNANPTTIESNGTDTVNLSVVATDDFSGINYVFINLSTIGGSATAAMTNASNTYWIITDATGAGNGSYSLPVNATDNAGNSNTSVNITLYVNDTTPPILSDNIPSDGTSNLTPTISIKATDKGAGINTSSANMTVNNTPVILASTSSGFTFNFTNTTAATFSHGDTVNVTFNITDNEGHINNTSWMFYIDNVTPTITITSPDHGDYTTASSITVSGTANGTGSPYSVTINGVLVEPVNDIFSTTISLSIGTNTIYANVTDAAGNAKSTHVNVTRTTLTTPSSSGGGGGGGGASGEDFNNIAETQTRRTSIFKGDHVSYTFENTLNPIVYINFTAKVSAGKVASKIEVLRNTSSMVDTPAPGNVYKNINIWVGNYGWATENNIEDMTVTFTIPLEWITSNNIDEDSITLYRYSNETWGALPTSKTARNGNSLHFTSSTPGFSPFAISSEPIPAPTAIKTPTTTPAPTIKAQTGDASVNENRGVKKIDQGKVLFWVLFIAIILLGIAAALTGKDKLRADINNMRERFGR